MDGAFIAPLLLALPILLASSSTPSVSATVDASSQACRNHATCGGLNISFPFYIRDRQQAICGFPGFDISCLDDQPLLNLSNAFYIMRGVDYRSQSIRVVNAGLSLNWTGSCESPWMIQNLTLVGNQFELVPDVRNLFLFYDCDTSSLRPDDGLSQRRINCSASRNTTLLGLYVDDPEMGNASRRCKSVVETPVEVKGGEGIEFNGSETGEAELVIGRGFGMKWSASNCSVCEDSGGRCGFDYETYGFTCFCPDRPHFCCCVRPSGMATDGKQGLSPGLVFGVGGAVLLLFSIAGFVWFLKKGKTLVFCEGKYNKSNRDIEQFIRNYGSFTPKRFSYSNIKRMTGSFREKLGQGGFGTVYKGELPDGTPVAVKLLKSTKDGDGKEFINEVASISRTAHVNVVTLLGFCFEGRKRALMYEYMPNGSLDKYVYDETRNLGWERLYKIAIGIARGLEYLHQGCNIRILHFDIKPHNILLDGDLYPKISDFGLSKLCLRRESAVSMLVARGTIGYIAPEVISSNFGAVSHKSDVYSYGMMIIEMVGGRKNVNARADRSSDVYFPNQVYRIIEQGYEYFTLGRWQISTPEESEIARKMALVGLWCIQADPSQRPSMSRAIEMLEGSLESLRIPPNPFLFSPARSPPEDSFSTSSTLL